MKSANKKVYSFEALKSELIDIVTDSGAYFFEGLGQESESKCEGQSPYQDFQNKYAHWLAQDLSGKDSSSPTTVIETPSTMSTAQDNKNRERFQLLSECCLVIPKIRKAITDFNFSTSDVKRKGVLSEDQVVEELADLETLLQESFQVEESLANEQAQCSPVDVRGESATENCVGCEETKVGGKHPTHSSDLFMMGEFKRCVKNFLDSAGRSYLFYRKYQSDHGSTLADEAGAEGEYESFMALFNALPAPGRSVFLSKVVGVEHEAKLARKGVATVAERVDEEVSKIGKVRAAQVEQGFECAVIDNNILLLFAAEAEQLLSDIYLDTVFDESSLYSPEQRSFFVTNVLAWLDQLDSKVSKVLKTSKSLEGFKENGGSKKAIEKDQALLGIETESLEEEKEKISSYVKASIGLDGFEWVLKTKESRQEFRKKAEALLKGLEFKAVFNGLKPADQATLLKDVFKIIGEIKGEGRRKAAIQQCVASFVFGYSLGDADVGFLAEEANYYGNFLIENKLILKWAASVVKEEERSAEKNDVSATCLEGVSVKKSSSLRGLFSDADKSVTLNALFVSYQKHKEQEYKSYRNPLKNTIVGPLIALCLYIVYCCKFKMKKGREKQKIYLQSKISLFSKELKKQSSAGKGSIEGVEAANDSAAQAGSTVSSAAFAS